MIDIHAAAIQTPPGRVIDPGYLDEALGQADRHVDLAVLPELCTTPYFPLEEGSEDASGPLHLDGPELAAFGEVARAHACHLMVGVHLEEDGRRFNAAVLLRPDGEVLEGRASGGGLARAFAKVHLCDVQLPPMRFHESSYFSPGAEYLVWETPLGVIAALICYDRHFPEAWLNVRELGAEVVCICTTSAGNMEGLFAAEMQAMSFQQSLYTITANRVGAEQLSTSGIRTEFLGASCITGPFGELLAAAPERESQPIVTADLRAEELYRARAANQFHEHRRPDVRVVGRPNEQEKIA
jgi:predicted amidohydrolase